jgi:hypothetical protein
MASPPAEETILFRPNKKRKIYRQRNHDDEAEEAQPQRSPAAITPDTAQSLDELISTASQPVGADADMEVEGARVSMAEILRLRKLKKTGRRGGVEFRAEGLGGAGLRHGDGEMVLRDPDLNDGIKGDGQGGDAGAATGEPVLGSARRFAPQTGMVGDVNKHM